MMVMKKIAAACIASSLAAAGASYGQFQQNEAGQPGQQPGQAQEQEQAAMGEAQVRQREGPVIELQDQQQVTITAMFRQEHDAPEIVVHESSSDQASQAREILFSPEQAQNRVVTYEGQPQGGQERSLVVTARRQNEDVQVEQISQQEGIIVLGIRRQQEQDQQAMQTGQQQTGQQPGQEQAGQQQPGQVDPQAGQEAMQPDAQAADAQMQQPGMQQDQQTGTAQSEQPPADQQAQQVEAQPGMQQEDARLAADQAAQEQPEPDVYDAVIVIFLSSPN